MVQEFHLEGGPAVGLLVGDEENCPERAAGELLMEKVKSLEFLVLTHNCRN